MILIPGNQVAEHIRTILGNAREARVAVAFWGHGAAEALGLANTSCPLRIVCNLDTGGTNPGEVRSLLEIPGAEVRTNPNLHAKVWWTDKAVIVGSANASANGLGFEGAELSGWIEASVLTTDTAVIDAVARWFDNEVWPTTAGSRIVGETDLERALRLWQQRRRERPYVWHEHSLLDELLANPEAFRDRGDVIAVYGYGRLSRTAEELQIEAQEQRGDSKLEVYEGWEDVLSPGACVVDFRTYQTGRSPSLRGIWRIVNDEHVVRRDGTSISLCHKVPNIRGLGLPNDDLPRWIDLIERLDWGEDDWRRPLYDFALEARSVKRRPRR